MSKTPWAQEFDAKREAWSDVNRLEKEVKRLRDENERLKHRNVLIGYTNGNQIEYAKKSSGVFYSDTKGTCYIPVYMLKIHEHRIETTKAFYLNSDQSKKQGE